MLAMNVVMLSASMNSDNTAIDPVAMDTRLIRRRFDAAAATFDDADFLHRKTEQELLERLQPLTLEPKVILDCGCATGGSAKALMQRYSPERLLCADSSAPMLRTAKKKRGWFSKQRELQLDACRLPLRDNSVDMIFANLLLPWLNNPTLFFEEVSRVLRTDGVFAFSSLGPDTLSEVRAAWASVDSNPHVHRFTDMHIIGDELMRCGLRDPVLDVDHQQVAYESLDKAFSDLTSVGGRNSLQSRRQSLSGRSTMKRFRQALAPDGKLNLRLELVFGHAFGGAGGGGEFRISPDRIGRRR